ncbi:hypothetical protein TNCV_3209981 [Trichonephila clavipes]|nr:hypothetical protein TNCV_3209981 [Trichonephila clavipes]
MAVEPPVELVDEGRPRPPPGVFTLNIGVKSRDKLHCHLHSAQSYESSQSLSFYLMSSSDSKLEQDSSPLSDSFLEKAIATN